MICLNDLFPALVFDRSSRARFSWLLQVKEISIISHIFIIASDGEFLTRTFVRRAIVFVRRCFAFKLHDRCNFRFWVSQNTDAGWVLQILAISALLCFYLCLFAPSPPMQQKRPRTIFLRSLHQTDRISTDWLHRVGQSAFQPLFRDFN